MSDPIRVAGSEQTRPGSFLGPEQRASAWERLGSEQFDVVVIGGGVVGSGSALDAATRGLKVAMVEARDFASGTSSRSSKMFHGGLRYLEQLEFGLVREALFERELSLTTLAPHLVKPLPFSVPTDQAVVGAALRRGRPRAVRRTRRREIRSGAEAFDARRCVAAVPRSEAQRADRRCPLLRHRRRRCPAHPDRRAYCRALRRGGAVVHSSGLVAARR